MPISEEYRRNLRERLTGRKVRSAEALHEDTSSVVESSAGPLDFWNNKPEAKRNFSENNQGSPYKWTWGEKIGSKVPEDLHESPTPSLIKEQKEETPKTVDTFDTPKYKVI